MNKIRKEALVLSLTAILSMGCSNNKKPVDAPYVSINTGREVVEVINGKTIDVNLIDNTLCINDKLYEVKDGKLYNKKIVNISTVEYTESKSSDLHEMYLQNDLGMLRIDKVDDMSLAQSYKDAQGNEVFYSTYGQVIDNVEVSLSKADQDTINNVLDIIENYSLSLKK